MYHKFEIAKTFISATYKLALFLALFISMKPIGMEMEESGT
jgi:hypothetical protein